MSSRAAPGTCGHADHAHLAPLTYDPRSAGVAAPQCQRDEWFQVGWGRCVVATVGERPASPVCVVLRGLEGTAIGAGAVHEARLGGTFPLTAACLTVLM